MSRLAIVIPSVGSVAALESTLLAVLENRPPRTEIAVVHAHPYDDPYQLEGDVRLIKAPPRSSLVACANFGIGEVTAEVVHLLAPGCHVREGWTDGVLRHFADPRVAVVAPLLIDEAEPTHAVSAGLQYLAGGSVRTATKFVADVVESGISPILAASPAAAFYRRLTLVTVGMLSNQVGADLAGIDLGLLLRHAGFASLVDPRTQVRVPNRRLETLSAFRQAVHAERFFWRNAPLAGWSRSLAAHPTTLTSDVLKHLDGMQAVSTLAGRMVGAAMVGSARRHHRRLNELLNSAPVAATLPHTLRIDRPHDGHGVRTTPTVKAA